jgi:hypothetical protein
MIITFIHPLDLKKIPVRRLSDPETERAHRV